MGTALDWGETLELQLKFDISGTHKQHGLVIRRDTSQVSFLLMCDKGFYMDVYVGQALSSQQWELVNAMGNQCLKLQGVQLLGHTVKEPMLELNRKESQTEQVKTCDTKCSADECGNNGEVKCWTG